MKTQIQAFRNFKALDGYHCVTNSLAKIFSFNGHPLSEEMLLGLGAGMGFIYWKMKLGDKDSVFIGGRGNNKEFFNDIGKRTGVKISQLTTSSSSKAETMLLNNLKQFKPVMVFGDMGFLPWFEFPVEYHFGGHTFVLCGYDGKETILASDMDSKASGLKQGFYFPITLDQLAKARGSTFKPFPPNNCSLEFDFSNFHPPLKEEICSAIKQCIEFQMSPPIKNLGVKGIRLSAMEIIKWPVMFSEKELRMNLFGLYIYFEIGGTGGGCFRYMYSRFLKEAAVICKNSKILEASEKLNHSGELFSKIANSFKDAENMKDIFTPLKKASLQFLEIASLEEQAYDILNGCIH